MSSTVEALEAEVLQLPAMERARLVESLIASLDVDPEVDEAWATEVERRHAEIEAGSVALMPGPKALAELRSEFSLRRVTLDDLLAEITPENVHAEIDAGAPVVREAW